MRIWSVHPRYLDQKGLVALWRETLLAQKVLQGATKGYCSHPQLHRFKAQKNPLERIGAYLTVLWQESQHRGYRFDHDKIIYPCAEISAVIEVSTKQMAYEWVHLMAKLQNRAPSWLEALAIPTDNFLPDPHSLFYVVKGEIAAWEILNKG